MRIAEIMSRGVETVPPGMPAVEAWDLMRRRGFHHLVVKNGSAVIGIISDRDAGGRHGANVRARATVGELMSRAVVTATADSTVRKIANLMRGRSIGCVPIVDGARLVGIVTVTDLLQVLGRGVDRPMAPPRRGIHHRVPHKKRRNSSGVW